MNIKTFFFPDSNLCYLKMRIHIFVMSKSESLCVRNGEPNDEPLLVWILAAWCSPKTKISNDKYLETILQPRDRVQSPKISAGSSGRPFYAVFYVDCTCQNLPITYCFTQEYLKYLLENSRILRVLETCKMKKSAR